MIKISTLGYALLGVLSTRSRTGWEIAKHMRSPIAYLWTAQHSQIYPELGRLTDAGLVRFEVVRGRGPRDTKRYSLTAAGRAALTSWADSPLAPQPRRSELLLRIRSLWLTSPERALAFVEAYRRRCAAELAALEEERTGFDPDGLNEPDHPEFFAYATLQYGLDATRAELAWCDWLLTRLRADQQADQQADQRASAAAMSAAKTTSESSCG